MKTPGTGLFLAILLPPFSKKRAWKNVRENAMGPVPCFSVKTPQAPSCPYPFDPPWVRSKGSRIGGEKWRENAAGDGNTKKLAMMIKVAYENWIAFLDAVEDKIFKAVFTGTKKSNLWSFLPPMTHCGLYG
jgi:hypothetical protein